MTEAITIKLNEKEFQIKKLTIYDYEILSKIVLKHVLISKNVNELETRESIDLALKVLNNGVSR